MMDDLIAPCGMNCRLCVAYQFREKDLNKKGYHRKYCPGCLPRGENCTHMAGSCELLANGRVRFCFECQDYPCKRLKALDKRYRTKYHMSMIENLDYIKGHGLEPFLAKESDSWRCPVCGGVICCHNGLCLDCDLDTLFQNKGYRWQKDGRKASIDLSIRKTKPADLSRVMDIYSDARAFMKEQDNPDQWKENHPPTSLIEEDIRLGKSHVCTRNQEIVGVFYFSPAEEDPTYSMIDEGQWLNDEPYGVIHRIAVGTRRLGVASFVLDWCWDCCRNIRIDTHENNQPMQQLLKRKGFSYCGVVRLSDGSPRLAYQKPSNRT